MKPYLIFTPDWSNYSAGVVVLHTLAHRLQNLGLEVYLNTAVQNPDWELIPTINKFDRDRKRMIGVYPEIVDGNPHNCGTVVKYLLHLPGFHGGPKSFPQNEMLFVHSDLFNQRIKLPQERVLAFPYINTNVFYDMRLCRKYRFYLSRKDNGVNYPDRRIADVPSIGTGKENDGKDGQLLLSERLNKTEVIYCYDNITAMVDIARLCGCAVVLIPDNFWTEEECKCFNGWGVGGIAYGVENEDHARETVSAQAMRQYYTVEFEEKAKAAVSNFIEITQKGN